MYDTIHIEKQLQTLPDKAMQRSTEPFEWCNLLWIPKYHRSGLVTGYTSSIRNLWLSLREDKLLIRNSLQKFYMGNNYEVFAFAKAVQALKLLDDYFPFSIYDAEVKHVACGIVIQEDAQLIFENWADYKGKFPHVMRNGTKVYGAHYKATDYNIKGYDKTYEVSISDRQKLNAPYFRFEIEAKAKYYNTRKDPIPIYTVSDLVSKENYDRLASNLLDTYQTIKKRPLIPYVALQPKEIRLIAVMNDKKAVNGLKKYHKHSYKTDRKRYTALISSLQQNPFENQVEEKLKSTIQQHL
ncbi:hypothetical protein BST86_03885 [Nonlabens agnitus]|uniref:Uncharacterized protein n=1 Tax=Nonlabens agnitus TaxID=870484 RepID=A0A2S9WS43_9FLAO|nr:hypothetical protein BST86_03885 [Nonlabens agnitus]